VAHAYFQFKHTVAGYDFLRIGDVTGPERAPGTMLRDVAWARTGWRWTKDPRFAFIVKHYLSRDAETDAEWARSSVRRHPAPRPVARSPLRVMPMWATILEAGLEHDDYRFRRAAYVRTASARP